MLGSIGFNPMPNISLGDMENIFDIENELEVISDDNIDTQYNSSTLSKDDIIKQFMLEQSIDDVHSTLKNISNTQLENKEIEAINSSSSQYSGDKQAARKQDNTVDKQLEELERKQEELKKKQEEISRLQREKEEQEKRQLEEQQRQELARIEQEKQRQIEEQERIKRIQQEAEEKARLQAEKIIKQREEELRQEQLRQEQLRQEQEREKQDQLKRDQLRKAKELQLKQLLAEKKKREDAIKRQKEKLVDHNSNQHIDTQIYDSLDADALYNEVRKFLKAHNIEKKIVDIRILETKFGKNNIKKLIVKSYLISIGKGVTIGK